MRITIEPTDPDNLQERFPSIKSSVEVPGDDHTIDDMYTLFRGAMVGAGYSAEAIDTYLKEQ